MDIPLDIASIATGASACDAMAAQEILTYMMKKRPYIASSLAIYDPTTRTHRTIASVGYSKRVLSHLDGWLVTDDIAYRLYRDQGDRQIALKWSEMPFNYYETFSVQEVFMPAGFREGITLRLHTRDGRYTGNLHISTDDPRYPTREMMANEVQCLQTILGNFTDLLRSFTAQFSGQLDGSSGCVLTHNGEVVDLPRVNPLPEKLREALASRISDLHQGQIPEVFLFRHGADWYRIHTGLLSGDARVIVAQACEIPYGLTMRELEIVDLLITGATNSEIASEIFVARTTVSKHLENIFDKTGCNTRTSVVRAALSKNLRQLPFFRGKH